MVVFGFFLIRGSLIYLDDVKRFCLSQFTIQGSDMADVLPVPFKESGSVRVNSHWVATGSQPVDRRLAGGAPEVSL